MYFWRTEDSSLDIGHLRINGYAKIPHVAVLVKARTQHEIINLALSIRRRSCRGLDHRGRLHVGELFDAPLTGHNVAHLQWQIRVLLLLAHLQARQMRVQQLDVVLIVKILGHRALKRLPGLQLQWKPSNPIKIFKCSIYRKFFFLIS